MRRRGNQPLEASLFRPTWRPRWEAISYQQILKECETDGSVEEYEKGRSVLLGLILLLSHKEGGNEVHPVSV